eukprot:211933_1
MATTNENMEIFKTLSDNCNIKKDTTVIIHNCDSLKRIAVGLKYYELLFQNKSIVNITEDNKLILIEFCNDAYPQFLDDMIHCIKMHSDSQQLMQIAGELQNIYGLMPCDLSKCNKMMRHYRQNLSTKTKNNVDDVQDDAKFEFLTDCFDRFHHHIFHLIPMGLKLEPIKLEENKTLDDEMESLSYDKLFEKMRDLIETRRKQCDLYLERYNDENNKYNMKISVQNDNPNSLEEHTFLSRLHIFITSQINDNMTSDHVSELMDYIYQNEYDTDAVVQDFDDLIER